MLIIFTNTPKSTDPQKALIFPLNISIFLNWINVVLKILSQLRVLFWPHKEFCVVQKCLDPHHLALNFNNVLFSFSTLSNLLHLYCNSAIIWPNQHYWLLAMQNEKIVQHNNLWVSVLSSFKEGSWWFHPNGDKLKWASTLVCQDKPPSTHDS